MPGLASVNSIAEKLKKKWGVVLLTLPTAPTSEFPFPGLAYFDHPVYNLFTHRIVIAILWQFSKNAVNNFRKFLQLPIAKTNMINKISKENRLNLHAISPSLLTRPHDWGTNTHISGFLSLQHKQNKKNISNQIPDGLEAWLQTKDKPIYIGFGSMPVPDPQLFGIILNEILNTTNLRILFCRGWSDIPDLPDNHPNLFIVEYINHEWLLPQCKVAMIHGGIGTVTTCLKSKIPFIVLSILSDQLWWGRIISKMALGFHIPFYKITTKKILKAIDFVQSPEIRGNVLNIGNKINKENSLKYNIDIIEKYFSA